MIKHYNRHQTLRGPPMPETFPAYFEMDGIPVCRESKQKLPEKYFPDGSKAEVRDPVEFATEAVAITKDQFDDLVKSTAKKG